jgi:hypothetical protein
MEVSRREKCSAIYKNQIEASITKSNFPALNQTLLLSLPQGVLITTAVVLVSATLKASTCNKLVQSLNEPLAATMPPREPLITGSKHANHVDYSTISSMEQLDQHVPIPRPSVLKRESFLVQVTTSRGPPEIMVIVLLYAFGFGSTIGIIPNLMASRFARLNHGYDDGEGDCSSLNFQDKPEACLAGSQDARNATAIANLISNTFTLLMSSMMGSISDIHGRRSEFCKGEKFAIFSLVIQMLLIPSPFLLL